MTGFVPEFLLEVWQVEQTCLFKLSWGQGNSLDACIPYPANLRQVYEDWSAAYKNYYRSKRASAGLKMIYSSATNWETRLNYTEQILITQFREWMRASQLFEIRKVLSEASKDNTQGNVSINLLIQCKDDINAKISQNSEFILAKLPWEQLGPELMDQIPIYVLRTTNKRPIAKKTAARSRLRILAILGDETGLSFKVERQAIEQKLKPIAYVQFEGWNITPVVQGKNLKGQLREAIDDPRGWDILFFAGHSDDKFGAELMLSPDISAFIDEFADVLKNARDRGLRFAFFNSCLGCPIAEELTSYGLAHVVVMREQVSNRVAQVFFQEFTHQLANYVDVQTATIRTCETLFHLAKERYEYPSAFLVPSIYTYGNVEPLTVPVLNWHVMLSRLRPTKREAIVLTALALISCQTFVQYALIDGRQLTQAMIRDVAGLIQSSPPPNPPILLVKLDDASLNAAGIVDKDPIDRGYMANLINQASRLKAPVIGIDYVFKDNNRPRQAELRQALANTKSRIVLGVSADGGTTYREIIDPQIRIDGDIDINVASDLRSQYPVFLARTIGDWQAKAFPFPQEILCQWKARSTGCNLNPSSAYHHPVTALSHVFGQQWLNPWIDYSIPTKEVYETVSSEDFLKRSQPISQIVLFVPGEDFDKYPIPNVLVNHRDGSMKPRDMAGGEIHAYQLYNLLQGSLLLPIPDIWMIGIVGIVSKLLLYWLQHLPRDRSISRRGWILLIGLLPLVAYVVSFYVYRFIGVMLPLIFPSLVYFSYLLPPWFQQRSRKRGSRKIVKG